MKALRQVSIIATVCCVAAWPVFAAPRLVCDAPEFNFGAVRNTQLVTHVFTIRNAGDATLELQPPHASCGCTAVTAGTLVLKPGESTTIQATIDLKGRSGPQHKTISIDSNDPQTPKLTLGLQLDIWQEFRILPPHLTLGRIRGDASVQTFATFENNSARAFAITNITCSSSNLEATVQADQPGRRFRIVVATRPPLSDGPLIAELRLQTDDPDHPEFSFNYAAHVRGLLVVVPPRIQVAASETGGVTKAVVISPGAEAAFKVVKVESPDPSLRVEWKPYAVPGSYRILLHDVKPRPELRGRTLKITTDLMSIQTIHVPIDVEEPAAPAK